MAIFTSGVALSADSAFLLALERVLRASRIFKIWTRESLAS